MLKMRNHCRKLASLVEHHESRADLAENSLKVWQQRKKASSREEYVEYVRVPRRGNNYTPSSLSTINQSQLISSMRELISTASLKLREAASRAA